MSVDEFLDRMPIIQRFILQPSSLRHENETVDFITFRMENISLAVRGMSVDTVKLEIPQKLDNMTMNGLQSDNTEIGDCVAQFWAAYGDETKLKMTDSIRSELLNQKQTSTTICVYVVRNIVTKDYRYYKSPALVIYLRGKRNIYTYALNQKFTENAIYCKNMIGCFIIALKTCL